MQQFDRKSVTSFVLPGYHLGQQLYESANSLVYRAIRAQDKHPIILKVLKPEHPQPEELTRYKQEYDILCRLDAPEVIKAYGLESYRHTLVLILEDFGGVSLNHWLEEEKSAGTAAFPLPQFLKLSSQIVTGLAQLHAAGVIHKHITPANIVFNPDTGELKLIDFGLATALRREMPTLKSPQVLEGTLAYLSPEQTGRMNRAVDYRTDFYSLGVTLYELLTGQLPFTSDDPLALVHAHIAKIPQPVTALNPAVPPIVSDIIMKLLAKNAEDRYQSAFGLKADLERCLAVLTGLEGSESLTNFRFKLGQDDYSGQLHIPQKLYGRTAEIATLLAAFERVAAGSQELMLVAGYAGVGKSALVAEVHKPVTAKRGYFISGKFDQYQQNTPYTAFTHAFNQLAELLLTEPEATLQQWRDTILTAVGSNGAVLTEVMPSLEKVIGTQPVVPKLGGYEHRNRFNLTFQNFVQAISTAEHPLVVSIDDWQWADLASLELLKVLLTGEKMTYILLIGAYRDNEVDQTHPFMMTLNALIAAGAAVQIIELGNLQAADVGQLIQESLSGSPANSQVLAGLVYAKTQGNAFFTHQFLQNLYVEGWLQFDFNTRCWMWDIVQLKAQQITDNVVELMARKLRKLSSETANLLQLAACIGNEFDVQTLALISQTSEPTTLEGLMEALTQGLVIPLDDYYKLPDTAAQARFRFLHDRVQQAAYAQIATPERQRVHVMIGRLLLANTPETDLNQRVFEIVQHYNQANTLITTEAERLRVAELNMHAADMAYQAAAFRSAQAYLEAALALMPADAWTSQYDRMLKLHSQLATVFSLTGDAEQLERVFQITEAQAHTMADTAQVKQAKIQGLLYRGNFTEAIELGLAFVQAMGIPVNRHPSPEEAFNYLRETAEWLTPARIETLRNLPEAPAEIGLILEVASVINGPMYNSDMYCFFVFGSQITKLCIEQGLTPWAPVTLITFAIVLCSALHDIPKARLLTDVTMQVFKERYRSDSPISPLSLVIGGFLVHRYDHLKHTLPIFLEGVQKGLATGTFQFVGYCAWWQVWHQLFLGEPLTTAEAVSQQAEETCQKIQLGRMKDWCLLIHQAILNLQGKSEVPWILKGDVYDEQEKLALAFQLNDLADVFRIFFYKAWLHYVFGQPQASVNFFRETESYALYGGGTYLIPLFYFYDTLANAAVCDQQTADERLQILERINRNLKELDVWVRFAPMNHQHKKDLMEAEKARLEGRSWEAVTFYEKAVQGARENEFLHEEALACERAAEFYLSCGMEDIAQIYMTRAHDGYSRWQAWAKVQDLEQRHRQWFMKPASISSKDSAVEYPEELRSLDLKSVMKASQAISGQIVLEELLRKLIAIVIENAGAQRGCLILEEDGKWVIEAEGTADSKDVMTLQAIDVEKSDTVCPSIVRYVARSRESIVLADAAQKGFFINDPYVKQNQTKSILCTPLLNRGRLSGILYLENNLAANAFTPERIEVLELLAGQAAIALENATLYQQAQQEIAERKLAEAALRESEQRFRTIFDSVNDAILVHDLTTGDILDVNAKMCTMYGYTRAEALQIKIEDLSSGEPPYTWRDALAWIRKAVEEGPQLFEWRAKDKDGRLFWVEVNMRLASIGGQDRVLVVVRDIIERKRMDAALRESRAMLKQILDTVPQSIFWKDKDSVFLGCNQVFATAAGISAPEDIIGKTDFDLPWPRHEAEAYRADDALVIASQTPRRHIIEPLQQADGVRLWIDTTKQPLVDSHGDIYGVLGVYEDITERKQAEEALRKSEERFRLLVETTSDLVWEIDLNGIYTYASPQVCEVLGYELEEVIGKTPFDLMLPDEAIRVGALFQDIAANQRPIVRLENTVRHKDGRHVVLETSDKPFFDADGRLLGYRGIGRDITERKRIEEALEKRIVALTRPLDTAKRIEFEDLFNLADIQHLQDLYAKAFGVAALITRPDGTPITQPSNFTEFCGEIIRKTSKGVENCNYSDAMIGRYNPSGPNIQSCLSAGLCNAGASISVGGRHIANWLIGQVRNETQDEEEIMTYAREIGADETAFRAAYRKVPSMSQEQFERVAQLLFVLANQLSTSAYQNVQQARFIAERKQAEEALRKSEERFRLFMQHFPGLAYMKDSDTRNLFANQGFMTYLNIAPAEILGKTNQDIFPPEFAEQVTTDDLRVIESEQSQEIEEHYGGRIWSTYKFVIPQTAKPPLLGGFTLDITERKRAEDSLKRSEAFLDSIIEHSPHSMWISDSQGTLIRLNQACRDLLHLKDEEVIGKYNVLQDNIVKEQGALSLVRQVFERGETVTFTLRYDSSRLEHHRLAETVFVILDVTISPVLDTSGQVTNAIVQHVDITERKQAEAALRESEQKFRTVVQNADAIIFILDRNGVFLLSEGQGLAKLGLLSDQIVGMSALEVYRDIPAVVDGIKRALTGEQVHAIAEVQGIVFDTVYSPYYNIEGVLTGVIGIALDITERKQAEAEREKLIVELEAKNAELERFTYTVSHDLKSPLVTVRGFLGFLEQDAANGDLERLRKDMQRIREATDTMQQLLNDLLELSRIGRVMNPPQELAFADLVQDALERLASPIVERGLQVTVASPLPRVYGDRPRLVEVLQNLVENAIKFCGDQPEPRITIGSKHLGDEVVFSVADNGIGIAPQYHEKIFGLFERLDPTIEGTGVGLALVKRIIEVHGGRIWVESEGQGQGSTFYFTLPQPEGGTI